MTDQDPQFGPLRRLDPAEPEEGELGRLKPLDPEADEPPPPMRAEPAPARSRPRDGLALAVALAVLLSLSSIAAIGGLVAISSQSIAPTGTPALTSPIDTAASGPTIRVTEAASGQDRETDRRRPGESASGPSADGQAAAGSGATSGVTPQPAVAPEPAPAPGGGSSDGDGSGGGGNGRRRLLNSGGAWCDATPGSSCDVVVGGPKTKHGKSHSKGMSVEDDGFVREDEEGVELDYDEDDDGETSSHSSSHSH